MDEKKIYTPPAVVTYDDETILEELGPAQAQYGTPNNPPTGGGGGGQGPIS